MATNKQAGKGAKATSRKAPARKPASAQPRKKTSATASARRAPQRDKDPVKPVAAEQAAQQGEEGAEAGFSNHDNNFEPRDFAGALWHYIKADTLKREGAKIVGETKKIIKGESALDLSRDRRFRDTSWQENGFYKRLGQSYLAFCDALEGLVEEDDSDPMRHEKAKLAVDHITSLVSPTNTLVGNPAALKKAYESRGKSLVKGARNFLDDLINNKGMPSQVEMGELVVGEDLAVTEGGVVYRNDFLEIIQYRPATAQVYEIPLLVMTPQINRYYFLDLAPGRSFVEYMTSQGYQVFVVSWKNPGPQQGQWRLEDYCSALLGAIKAIIDITNAPSVNTFGFCAGGITMSSLLSYLNQSGQGDLVNAVSYAVTMMDFSHPAMIGILKSNYLLKFAKGNSRVRGVLDGGDLATMFTMLRPKDLIWDNWVNNYLLGNSAPVFDILTWNQDSTNLPGGLHSDYLNIFNDNLMTKAGGMDILGEPLDVSKITQDCFVVGTVTDHLTPWQGCYRTTQLVGGDAKFVLGSAGHVAGLVCPPGNPKSFYFTGPEPGPDPKQWLSEAEKHTGSWWEHWAQQWAAERSGRRKRARKTLGNKKYPVLVDAPGTYVFEKP